MIKNKMLQAEWKHLFNNKILLISMAVISFIPILYSGFFLGSIWDPYGQTKNLPVAFVNEDKGASLNGKSLNIGESIEKKLKDNHDLGFPSDFSQKAASITESEPQQAVINFTTTPAKNYIGSLVSNQAAAKVKSSVSEQITQAYAKGILENLDKLGTGLDAAANGASTLHDGLGRLQSGTQTYVGGVKQLAVNQQSLTGGLAQLSDGSRKLQAGLGQLSNNLPTESQLSQLSDGMKQLQSGINQLNASVSNPSPALVAQQNKVETEAQTLAQTMRASESDLSAAGDTLRTLSAQVAASGSDSTTISLPQISNISQAFTKTQTIIEQTTTLCKDLRVLNQQLSAQQTQFQAGVSVLNNGVNQLTPNAITAFNGYNSVRFANNQLLAGSASLTNGLS